jgi:hypothetical protein
MTGRLRISKQIDQPTGFNAKSKNESDMARQKLVRRRRLTGRGDNTLGQDRPGLIYGWRWTITSHDSCYNVAQLPLSRIAKVLVNEPTKQHD